MSPLDVADNKVAADTERAPSAYVPPLQHLAMHLEGHLAELDINPLMVLPSGQGVKAVDALVVLRGYEWIDEGGEEQQKHNEAD